MPLVIDRRQFEPVTTAVTGDGKVEAAIVVDDGDSDRGHTVLLAEASRHRFDPFVPGDLPCPSLSPSVDARR